ncbi:sensor domain-containing protein [bacterium]|nr:sensor domain-containing protein [bacterium]
MSEEIERYLGTLRTVLAGSDAATVQDAVGDAEEHLRTALEQARRDSPGTSESDLLAPILAQYGSAEEVAKAYRDFETRMVPAFAPPAPRVGRHPAERFFGVLGEPRAYAALLFMLLSLVTGVVYFTWAVTGLSLSLGLAITVLGLPLFGFFVYSIEGLALVEGRIIEALLGIRMPRRQAPPRQGLGMWGRFKARVTDKRSWTSILYMILTLPMGVLFFTVFVTLLVYALQLILYPAMQILFDVPFFVVSNVRYFIPLWLYPFCLVAGILELIVILNLAKLAGRAYGAMAKAMLVRG